MLKLYMVLANIFLKSYISKICNGFSLYSSIFVANNPFATKIIKKKMDT